MRDDPLRPWVRQAEHDQGRRPGVTTDEAQQLKQLAREVFELKRVNEILRKASAHRAQADHYAVGTRAMQQL